MLDPAKVLVNWPANVVTTLLERPLFGFATYGRVRFHNRSVTEFLAAERLLFLVSQGLPIRTLTRLLFATTPEGPRVVKPSLRPVAAWLAPHLPPVCQELLKHDPSILLRYGDPGSLDASLRIRALQRYVEMYGSGGWRGLNIPRLQVERLATRDLDHVVERLWDRAIENPEVRQTLLGLIGAGQMARCADIAHGVATNPSNGLDDRMNGLDALVRLQDARLPEILEAMGSTSPDWPESLVRSTIIHLFPDHLTVRQLLPLLATPVDA